MIRWILAAVLIGLFPTSFLGGCAGGTSSTAENPGLVIGFRMDGQPVDFGGHVAVYASGKNPGFYGLPPTDLSDPRVVIEMGTGWNNSSKFLRSQRFQKVGRDFLIEVADTRISLPLLPPTMEGDRLPIMAVQGQRGLGLDRPFSLVFNGDSVVGFLDGLRGENLVEGKGHFRDASGAVVETLWVDLAKQVSVSGVLDTAGVKSAPLVLFTPGLPFAVRVHGDRFHLDRFPMAKMALRVLTASGEIYGLADSVDLTKAGNPGFGDTLATLKPGSRVDSVPLPPSYPTVAAPKASPEGPHSFTDSVRVTLSAESGAIIHYTTDGSLPGLHSPKYSAPLVLRSTVNLQSVAFKEGSYRSPVAVNTYLLVPLPPKATPTSKAFRDSLVITLETSARNGSVLYTTDGSAPNSSSSRYTAPIMVKETTVLKAVTSVPGMLLSATIEERYILVTDSLSAE